MIRTLRLQAVWYLAAIILSIGMLGFVIICTWIGYEVKRACLAATRQFSGDCVDALRLVVTDDHQGFRTRNTAIWALGELGDDRALPTLQSIYTGVIPDREPLDTMISQYELKKAIALVQGGPNLTAFVWRWMIRE